MGTCCQRNLSKYHASLHLHGWDSVGVSHGSSEWGRERLLVDIPPIEKVERVVLMVRERPHIRVDFLTVWNSIDKSSKTQPYLRARVRALCERAPGCTVHPNLLACPHSSQRHGLKHTLRFSVSLRFPPRHVDALTCKHAHTHSRGCLSGMRDRAVLALKEA